MNKTIKYFIRNLIDYVRCDFGMNDQGLQDIMKGIVTSLSQLEELTLNIEKYQLV